MQPASAELVAILACIHCAPVSTLLALVSMLPALLKSACMPCLALHVRLQTCCADNQMQVWVRQAICHIAPFSQTL